MYDRWKNVSKELPKTATVVYTRDSKGTISEGFYMLGKWYYTDLEPMAEIVESWQYIE